MLQPEETIVGTFILCMLVGLLFQWLVGCSSISYYETGYLDRLEVDCSSGVCVNRIYPERY